MQQQEIQIIKSKLREWMHEFDAGNRNNRLSPCMIAGMGGFLENLIMEIISEVNNVKPKEGK